MKVIVHTNNGKEIMTLSIKVLVILSFLCTAAGFVLQFFRLFPAWQSLPFQLSTVFLWALYLAILRRFTLLTECVHGIVISHRIQDGFDASKPERQE
jgi:4-hydroxybenzoate polyprenyltransferase